MEYTGAAAQLEGGVGWSASGRTFRAALLQIGSVGFVAADATVTAVLARDNNAIREDTGRVTLEMESRLVGVATRQLRFKSTNQVLDKLFREGTGAVLVYEFITDDDGSKPLLFQGPGAFNGLTNGEGLVLQYLETGVAFTAEQSRSEEVVEFLADGLLSAPGLDISATPEEFLVDAFSYTLAGIQRNKDADLTVPFSAAHPVTASKFGAILVQINGAGTISTKISGATQTTTQAYNTGALAIAALPAVTAGNLKVGHIVISADSGGWVAITDDMTAASDLTAATFTDGDVKSQPS